MRRLPAICSALCSLALVAAGTGCGEGGAAGGAKVSVYVAAPLCGEAAGALQREGGKAGDLEVQTICLPRVERKHRADLATAGGNARRATEDSSAVAYLEAPGAAAKFSRPIVESAQIAWVETSSGAKAMQQVLASLDQRGSSSPRSAVRESIGSD